MAAGSRLRRKGAGRTSPARASADEGRLSRHSLIRNFRIGEEAPIGGWQTRVKERSGLQHLAQRHGGHHVAFDPHLAGHIGRTRVQFAADERLEILGRHADGAFGVAIASKSSFDMVMVQSAPRSCVSTSWPSIIMTPSAPRSILTDRSKPLSASRSPILAAMVSISMVLSLFWRPVRASVRSGGKGRPHGITRSLRRGFPLPSMYDYGGGTPPTEPSIMAPAPSGVGYCNAPASETSGSRRVDPLRICSFDR